MLRERIPTYEVLVTTVNTVVRERYGQISGETALLRQVVILHRKQTATSFFIFLLSAFSLPVLSTVLPRGFLAGILAILLILVLYYGRKWLLAQRTLTKALTRAFIPSLSVILGQTVTLSEETEHGDSTKQLFSTSGLLGESVDTVTVDDAYSCASPYPHTVREIHATRQESDGKRSRTVTVFKGLFVTLSLPKALTGETYISTEGDKYGFAHERFWTRMLGERQIEKTELEWNEFEKDLHVATNDPVEARYILTPNFMSDLHAWWSEGKENIRLCFKGNELNMLLPDSQVQLGYATASEREDKLATYLLSMAKPLWRTILLAEDIRI
jgi:Protein of unknown function (DUF3137)